MNRAGKAQREAAIRAASEWLVALQDNAATPGERHRFADWLHESPLHVHEFLMAEYVWGLLGEALNDTDCRDADELAGVRVLPLCLPANDGPRHGPCSDRTVFRPS